MITNILFAIGLAVALLISNFDGQAVGELRNWPPLTSEDIRHAKIGLLVIRSVLFLLSAGLFLYGMH